MVQPEALPAILHSRLLTAGKILQFRIADAIDELADRSIILSRHLVSSFILGDVTGC